MTKPKSPKKPKKQKSVKREPPTRDEAMRLLPAIIQRRRRTEAEFRQLEREFFAVRDQHIDAMVLLLNEAAGKLRDKLGYVKRVAIAAEKLTVIIGETNAPIVLDTAKVEDPLMTMAEVVEQRRKYPTAHDVGRLSAKVNMVTMIGGFARFEKRTGDQVAAAMQFLSLYQRSQIMSDRAIDYAAPAVDTSWPGDSETLMINSEAARLELKGVKAMLGDPTYRLLERIIVHDVSARSIAGTHASGRRVMHVANRVRHALDRCAEHWHLAGIPKAEKAKILGWDDGSPAVFSGAVVNQRSKIGA